MDRIFRSCIQVGGVPEADDCYQNWIRLQEHDLDFQTEEDREVHDYLRMFYGQMSAPPDYTLLKEYFEKRDKIEVVTRLEEIRAAQPYIRTNFLSVVKSEFEQQLTKSLVMTCKEASVIAEHGKNLDKPVDGKKVLRGVHDAVNFLYGKLTGYVNVEAGEKLEGDISEDADEVIDEYEVTAKSNKLAGRNLFGLEPVDSSCAGHRPGEYWVHCAFPGELKTTLALNYMYNNTMVYGKNIFYAILEMQYRSLRRQMYVIHSSHGKFVTDWFEEDRRRGLPPDKCYVGLDYRKVRDGELDDVGVKRLKIVAQDFRSNRKGRPYIWRPQEQVRMDDIRRKAEMYHNKYGCDGIVIDYLGLVLPKHRTVDYVASINSVVTEGRLLALNFARGKSVPVLALFQINRQGKLRADKADGRYDMAAIAYANQIEKDSDVITYTYLNDVLRKEGRFYMGCLKNRENPIFERMVGKILWQSKRMRAIEPGLLDLESDKLEAMSKQVSLTTDDMLLG